MHAYRQTSEKKLGNTYDSFWFMNKNKAIYLASQQLLLTRPSYQIRGMVEGKNNISYKVKLVLDTVDASSL